MVWAGPSGEAVDEKFAREVTGRGGGWRLKSVPFTRGRMNNSNSNLILVTQTLLRNRTVRGKEKRQWQPPWSNSYGGLGSIRFRQKKKNAWHLKRRARLKYAELCFCFFSYICEICCTFDCETTCNNCFEACDSIHIRAHTHHGSLSCAKSSGNVAVESNKSPVVTKTKKPRLKWRGWR